MEKDLRATPLASSAKNDDDEHGLDSEHGHSHLPSRADVVIARRILEGLAIRDSGGDNGANGNHSCTDGSPTTTTTRHLPTELALRILSLADYVPVQTSRVDKPLRITTRVLSSSLVASRSDNNPTPILQCLTQTAVPYVVADAVPADARRVRRVTFRMRSVRTPARDDVDTWIFAIPHDLWWEATIVRPPPPAEESEGKSGGEAGDAGRETFEELRRSEGPPPAFRGIVEAEDMLRDIGYRFVQRSDDLPNLEARDSTAWVVYRSRIWHVHTDKEGVPKRWHRVDWTADQQGGGDRKCTDDGVDDGDSGRRPNGGEDRSFVEALKPGDVIVLWACARKHTWYLEVDAASIEVAYEPKMTL